METVLGAKLLSLWQRAGQAASWQVKQLQGLSDGVPGTGCNFSRYCQQPLQSAALIAHLQALLLAACPHEVITYQTSLKTAGNRHMAVAFVLHKCLHESFLKLLDC